MEKYKTPISKTCQMCSTAFTVEVNPADFQSWRDGVAIQRAMPYLSPNDRELLISGICGMCFDKMFRD